MLPPNVEAGFRFALDRVHDNLDTFAKLRGGHMPQRHAWFILCSQGSFGCT